MGGGVSPKSTGYTRFQLKKKKTIPIPAVQSISFGLDLTVSAAG